MIKTPKIYSINNHNKKFPNKNPTNPKPISPNNPQISPNHFQPIKTTNFLLKYKIPKNKKIIY